MTEPTLTVQLKIPYELIHKWFDDHTVMSPQMVEEWLCEADISEAIRDEKIQIRVTRF